MHGLRRRLLAAVTAAGAAFAIGAAAPVAAVEAPDKMIERIGNDLIQQVKDDEAIRGGDVHRLEAFVDQKVMPYVDFQRMTALAAGRYWREATPEQRRRLLDEFRAMLLRTYAGSMKHVGDQTLRMKPLRAAPDAKDVIVRSEIVQPGREPIPLDYRMRRDGEGWKIYDLNVLGVWIVETYRTQFAQEAAHGGVEALIRSLGDRNKQFGPSEGANPAAAPARTSDAGSARASTSAGFGTGSARA